MNSVVLIKQVPDTGLNLKLNNQGSLDESMLKWVISPYDEFALEEALKQKKEGKVFALSVGTEKGREALMQALALGADEAFHLVTKEALIDPLVLAKVIAKKLKSLDISLVFCGKLSSDLNNFAVPSMLAELLDFSLVSNVSRLEKKAEDFVLSRDCGAGVEETIKAKCPLIISADKGLNTPRYPSLPGIMKAKKKPYHKEDIEVSESNLKLLSLKIPDKKSDPEIFSGTPKEQVESLIQALKNKEKLL